MRQIGNNYPTGDWEGDVAFVITNHRDYGQEITWVWGDEVGLGAKDTWELPMNWYVIAIPRSGT